MELDYKKNKWFFTSAEKLVIGGKSAEQNDDLLRKLKSNAKQDYVAMHTSSPGSPFSVIISDKSPNEAEIKEAAIFTASFSKAWKLGAKKARVDIFRISQLYKIKSMKTGTWGVKGIVKHFIAPLELILTKQKGVLRAVPESAAKKSEKLVKIIPGKIKKDSVMTKIQLLVSEDLSQQELLSALPSGRFKVEAIK